MPTIADCFAHNDLSKRQSLPRHVTIILRIIFLFVTMPALPLPAEADKAYFPPMPPAVSKSAFFASQRACASSGQFSDQDCAAAFERVETLMSERAPKFADRYECVLQFRICDKSAEGYRPATLGVEIIRSRKGMVALPMLAIETSADLWRDSELAPPAGGGVAENAGRGDHSARVPASPFGALGLQATNFAPVGQPSIKSYRRHVEQVQLRLAQFEQGAKPRPNWRAER